MLKTLALLRILALILSCLLAAGCAAKTAGKTAPEPPKETVFDLAAATLYSTKAYIYEASAPGPVIMIVGGVQLATHSWMSNPRMTAKELIDYLTMLSWSALRGIVEVGGSLEVFNSQPHPSPALPSHLLH